jgi:hypothetical protein
MSRFSRWIDKVSDFLAPRKGLLPLIGIGLVLVNLALQVFPVGWLSSSQLFMNLGVIVAVLGLMVAWAL